MFKSILGDKKAGEVAEPPQISEDNLRDLGLGHVAYMLSIQTQSGSAIALHSASGETLGVFADYDTAFAEADSKDLHTVLVQ